MSEFIAVIGLEIHAQINTVSKMFCGCDNDACNKAPNTMVCPVCMGFPGTLPVLNQEAIKKACLASLALNLKINHFSRFERKNYFYPDLPKGYQISQYQKPLAEKGFIEIDTERGPKKIAITRLHLEDDAGKLTHIAGATLCDYNRSGTPLMEIVSEPEINSPEEAVLYAKEIQKILRTINASDADMEKGMMRFDINISIKKPEDVKFGTKAEVKNLNSFRALGKALEFEIKRQIELKKQGIEITQETRGFDNEKEETVSQRSKEEAHDYRYFPEPDLPPLALEEEFIAKMREKLLELPRQKKQRYVTQYHLQPHDIEILLENPDLADFFEAVIKKSPKPLKAATWITNMILNNLNLHKISIKDAKIKPEHIAELIEAVEKDEISLLVAKEEIFPEVWLSGENPQKIISKKGLKQETDKATLEKICDQVIAENPDPLNDLKNGKEKALGFLIGKAMQKSQGKGNPKLFGEIFRQKIL